MATADSVSARVRDLRQPGWRATEAQLQELVSQDLDVLTLYGMPLRPLPEHILEAAHRAAGELPLPPPSRGSLELREAIAAKVSLGRGRPVDPAGEVLVTNGAMQAVNVVCRALLEPGDEVLMPGPTFFFYGMIELVGGVPVYATSDEAAAWAWDPERIEAAITPRTKLLLLCSPVNPTGYVVPSQTLDEVFKIAERHDLLVLSDESYDRMVYSSSFVSAAQLSDFSDRLILIQSLTKSYAMAAWRVGYIVAPAALTDAFAKVLEWEVLYGSGICQAAATAAIMGPQDWLADIPQEFMAYRDAIWPTVNAAPGLSVVRPEATPYMFINVSDLAISGDAFADLLVQSYGVPATGGSHFGSADHIRVGFGAFDEQTRSELKQRITRAAETLATRRSAPLNAQGPS